MSDNAWVKCRLSVTSRTKAARNFAILYLLYLTSLSNATSKDIFSYDIESMHMKYGEFWTMIWENSEFLVKKISSKKCNYWLLTLVQAEYCWAILLHHQWVYLIWKTWPENEKCGRELDNKNQLWYSIFHLVNAFRFAQILLQYTDIWLYLIDQANNCFRSVFVAGILWCQILFLPKITCKIVIFKK